MGTTVRRALVGLVAVQVVAWVVGRIVSKRLTEGDDLSDEFKVAAVMGGTTFRSRAQHLRAGAAVASMGGIDLDLRDATLDPRGATLDLRATMGGLQVTVPKHWAVDLETSAVAGGVQANVTPPDELPEDAPCLHVRAVAVMGGALVTTPSDDD